MPRSVRLCALQWRLTAQASHPVNLQTLRCQLAQRWCLLALHAWCWGLAAQALSLLLCLRPQPPAAVCPPRCQACSAACPAPLNCHSAEDKLLACWLVDHRLLHRRGMTVAVVQVLGWAQQPFLTRLLVPLHARELRWTQFQDQPLSAAALKRHARQLSAKPEQAWSLPQAPAWLLPWLLQAQYSEAQKKWAQLDWSAIGLLRTRLLQLRVLALVHAALKLESCLLRLSGRPAAALQTLPRRLGHGEPGRQHWRCSLLAAGHSM